MVDRSFLTRKIAALEQKRFEHLANIQKAVALNRSEHGARINLAETERTLAKLYEALKDLSDDHEEGLRMNSFTN
ncbi:hypothetical protein FHS85_004795 [Rhodoligotrophos appendicifer]|uniref:hypothetical protein n=1 Tax=Rhodoligotrophos appendicifer TaxID=987056 RepID=UPI0011869260|nr:hypothetical protein [Rhodoligotrophos appendicifer]